MAIEKLFEQDLDILALSLNADQINKFRQYYELLVSENKKINLTTITECHDVYKKHFIDSLSLCKYGQAILAIFGDNNVIDIGTGAGFPGIPLKIAFPELQITLLDSANKRISFLENVVRHLSLAGVTLIHGRAEESAHLSSHREQYDLCVSRAVANLSTLSEYCLPFVKTAGMFIAYKADHTEAEISASQNGIALLGGQIDKTISFALPNSDISRTLVGIKKICETPAKYPRRAGLPGKKPL
jgi:16S rRNA (guanine527-N7)-methyltransferase